MKTCDWLIQLISQSESSKIQKVLIHFKNVSLWFFSDPSTTLHELRQNLITSRLLDQSIPQWVSEVKLNFFEKKKSNWVAARRFEVSEEKNSKKCWFLTFGVCKSLINIFLIFIATFLPFLAHCTMRGLCLWLHLLLY